MKTFKWRSRKFPDLLTCPSIWAFLHQSIKDLIQQKWQEIPSNLTLTQIWKLKQLQKRTNVIIKLTDKGSNIVLMSHTRYQSMCHAVLNNHTWYKSISSLAVRKFSGEFQGLCTEAFWQWLIDGDIGLLDYQVPTFYALPKTHKNLTSAPWLTHILGDRIINRKWQ